MHSLSRLHNKSSYWNAFYSAICLFPNMIMAWRRYKEFILWHKEYEIFLWSIISRVRYFCHVIMLKIWLSCARKYVDHYWKWTPILILIPIFNLKYIFYFFHVRTKSLIQRMLFQFNVTSFQKIIPLTVYHVWNDFWSFSIFFCLKAYFKPKIFLKFLYVNFRPMTIIFQNIYIWVIFQKFNLFFGAIHKIYGKWG